ncbi:provirus ancestral Env polyprotein [Plecturocebus cupreus]
MSHTIPQNEATLTNQFKPSNNTSPPFSWLTLVQQEANMLNLTKTMNITNCFLCASLSNSPLAAVPLRSGFSLSHSPTGPGTTLTDIPVFKAHSQNFSLCCKTASSSSPSCNTTVKVKSSLYVPPGGYFWSNGILTKLLMLPSLSLVCLSPWSCSYRQAVFLPVVVGLSLASCLVAAGLGSSALGYSVTSATQLEDKLSVAIKASAASLASLQRRITSLAQVTLQNRPALDLLTAGKGGTCLFLQEQCCYYINETGLVEENVDALYRLQEDL